MEAKDYSIMHCKDGNLYINRNQWTEFRSDDSKRFSEEDLKSIDSWIKQNNEYVHKDDFINDVEKYLTEKFIKDVSILAGGVVIINFDAAINNFVKYMKGK